MKVWDTIAERPDPCILFNFFQYLPTEFYEEDKKNWSKTKMRMSTIPKFHLMNRIGLKSKQVFKKHDCLEKKKKQTNKFFFF